MSAKRDYEDADDGEIQEPTTKRAKKQSSKARQHQSSGIDPTWGQKYVFSSSENATTIPVGEESDFEDDADAMAYLMSVRQEAGGIPHLLVAPKVQIGPQMPAGFKRRQRAPDDDTDDGEVSEDEDKEGLDRSLYTDGIGDTRGYYQDGAYVGISQDDEKNPHDDGEVVGEDDEQATQKALHNAYFTSLLSQYLHLRTILHSPLPSDAASRLSASQPTHVAGFGRNSSTMATWTRFLHTADPHPLQVAAMTKESVLRLLRVLLSGKFLRQGHQLPERTSRWLWALLARLPERGQLNHAEIGWVRDLGRRAVLLGRSLAEMAALRDELAEGGLGVNEGVDGSSSDEEVLADAEVDAVEGDDTTDGHMTEDPASSAPEPEKAESVKDDGAEEGEIAEDEDEEDVAMDTASDSDGEASEHDEQDLQDAKARLLAQLDDEPVSEAEREQEAASVRARMNMRATLNMILTVAGDFYGQRDLLEFREPFVGM